MRKIHVNIHTYIHTDIYMLTYTCVYIHVAGVRTPARLPKGVIAHAFGLRYHPPITQASRWEAAQLAPAATRYRPQAEPLVGEAEEKGSIKNCISFRGESTDRTPPDFLVIEKFYFECTDI